MEKMEHVLMSVTDISIIIFEYIGVAVILWAGIRGITHYVRRKEDARMVLARGLAAGLEFKMGSEILRTVIVRNFSEIGMVAGIILLRAVLAFLIHWEIRNEQ
ncbi:MULTISPECIES: DUF1622 domain-containing protein [Anaerostipes]|uniref:DUF1622 domain-containing protein n=1 Tax=Anaerostipes butyraticus TaxID=645466 RepID=A0A916Q606_9FIRM|nr:MULTISPECIES: DUF1622 domain-containing protein [Anaerostipes]GFO84917.1 hypothetical protein ANBU17_12640 [Anaerostipes butyraticus]HJC82640.1 DUF1622 domain-containing protein [Candidatus Anaerostipes avicola]